MSLLVGLNKIKQGLEEGNLSIVAEGYELLSGEKVVQTDKVTTAPMEKKKRGRPKSSKEKLIDKTMLMLKKGPNKFVDDKTLYREDVEFDKKHAKKTVDRRPPAKILKFNCEQCNKSYEVNAAFILQDSRKLCNNCCRRS